VIGPPNDLDRKRQQRAAEAHRNALRSVNDIARRALSGDGERRMQALANISRVSANALQEGLR
jgi:hypothetical protein